MANGSDSVGFDAASLARIAALKTQVATFDGTLALETEAQVAVLARAVAAAMHDQFEPHDRTGKNNDPSQWKRNYKHTIDTIEVHVFGLHAEIVMRGGAVFVEYRSNPHIIEARNGPYLHFKGPRGWVQVEAVHHPGYAGDDFVGRAIDSVSLVKALDKIFSHVRIAQWTTGAYSTGETSTRV